MKTSIEWAEHSVNPIRARHKKTGKVGHYCEKIASGCARCYSSDMQKRFGTPAFGSGQHRDEFDIFLDESKLEEVRRRKKPTRYFWCSMTDFFGDWMEAAWLAKCFATMDATPQHHHMLLTKRPGNIRRMWAVKNDKRPIFPGMPGPLGEPQQCIVTGAHRPNVHLYYSASDQPSLEAGIDDLLACRDLTPTLGLSIEPLVWGIDLRKYLHLLDHIIIGGESGPGARPCNLAWIRSLLKQCRDAVVACFLKQLGAMAFTQHPGIEWKEFNWVYDDVLEFNDPKGGDESEWPEDLQGVRQFPKSFEGVNT